MEKFIKIDPHVHSKGISLCSQVTYEEIVDEKLRCGYDGAVLTNHCQPWYYPAEEHSHYVERVIEEFHRGKAYADGKNFRLYLGLEVTIVEPSYSDWLLYGVSEAFLRASPCLYRCTQEDLFFLCEEWGIVLVQAHPFRGQQRPGNPLYMHGLEINCKAGDIERASDVEAFAKEHGLIVTCGTDYHGIERECCGGILLPEGCASAEALAAYIRREKTVNFFQNEKISSFSNAKIVEK